MLLAAGQASPEWAAAQGFDLEAPSAILMVASTGQVLYEKNADEPRPPASLAKIMTLLLVMEALRDGRVSLDEPVVTSRYAASMGGSQVYLAEGERQSLEKMIEAVAIASGNDAAVALAEHLYGTEAAFVAQMNRRAEELGLRGTYFADATGLPVPAGQRPGVTTARDVAVMSRVLIQEHPQILEWTSIRTKEFRSQPRFILYNTNKLLGSYPGLDGLKTGHTSEAGYHLAATAEQNGIRLIAVVMGTKSEADRNAQVTQLLNYGFRAFEPVMAARKGEPVGEMRLAHGNPERFTVEAAADLQVLIPRGRQGDLRRAVQWADAVEAPLKRGDRVGSVVAYLGDQPLAQVDVVAAQDVERAGFFTRLWRTVWGGVTGAIGGAIRWVWEAIRSLLGLA
ncbi:MAG TPA: D-alanyl-D-alanine carboxypeptidase family protein [Limnochorda sp.]